MSAVVWFRRDLRLEDNPAWAEATSDHDEVRPLFIIDPKLWIPSHRLTQLIAHLHGLDAAIQKSGGRLCVMTGNPATVLKTVLAAGDDLYFNDDYSPYATKRDNAVTYAFGERVKRMNGTAVHAPGTILTNSETPYKVFTPFHRRWADQELPAPARQGKAKVTDDVGEGLPQLSETPLMEGGPKAARKRLAEFEKVVDDYADLRNRPDLDSTSHLSADLKFGTLSPVRVMIEIGSKTPSRAAFVRQIAWRDFYMHLMHHFPHTVEAPLRPEYRDLWWRNDEDAFIKWKTGNTGYPIIDAGMRQLLSEGWMHNRVRMLTASFLVKDLLIDWRWGEQHFMKLLVDGDVAQNVGNWQWVAGTGADAAPYFRIFNPVTQGKKFDPDGDYVRRYVPELSELGSAHIHDPWGAGPLELAAAGIELGDHYPLPMVDHAEARQEALAMYEMARGQSDG